MSGNFLNSALDDSLKKTLWIWLPFYAIVRLTKEILKLAKKTDK